VCWFLCILSHYRHGAVHDRLGIEGLVMFTSSLESGAKDVTMSVLDKVMVNIKVEKDKNTH
jgi:hypothetical protein